MRMSKLLGSNCNVGHVDRLLRITLGIVLMGLADLNLIGSWGWLGVIPLFTGVLHYCPLYALLGINTYRNADYVE